MGRREIGRAESSFMTDVNEIKLLIAYVSKGLCMFDGAMCLKHVSSQTQYVSQQKSVFMKRVRIERCGMATRRPHKDRQGAVRLNNLNNNPREHGVCSTEWRAGVSNTTGLEFFLLLLSR